MKNTLVITRRELTEKRFVILTAIAFSMLSMILPFVPGVHAGERHNAMAVISLLLAAGFTAGLATILGASIIGRELSDGRLSFYFARPISSASIWFGKLIAATLLIVVSFAVIIAPAFFAGISGVVRTWTNMGDTLPVIRIVLIGAAALFLLGHVISTFVRSRSAWLIFDFVAATVCGIAIWMIGRALLSGYAIDLNRRLWETFFVLVCAAIVAAGFWQIARGRTDRKRSHVELSRFLWMVVGGALLVMIGFTAWITSVSFSNLNPDWLDQSRTGQWAIVNGLGKHRFDYRASFLYSVPAGRAYRIPSALGQWSAIEFSNDEKTVGWASRATLTSSAPIELYTARLDGPEPQVVATGIPGSGNFSFSADGSRAAVSSGDNLIAVYDLASRKSLGTVRVPNAGWIITMFVSNDVVRIFDHQKNATRIYEYDVATRAFGQTGEAAAPMFRFNAGMTRAIVFWKQPDVTIYDAKTGRLVMTIPVQAVSAKFLADGRTVAIDDKNVMHVFTADGAPAQTIALPAEPYSPVFDVGGGIVVVLVKKDQNALVIDLNRGAIVRTETGLMPAYHGQGPLLLCQNKQRDLLVWNPATGEKRLILKRS